MLSQEVILLSFAILVGIYRLRVWSVKWRSLHPKSIQEDVKFKTAKKTDGSQEIIPLPSFNWRRTEPIKFRPFKPKYHLTMAVKNSPPSELIEMDNTYLTRLAIRKQIMDEHSEIALAASPVAVPAINELYVYLTNIYLPTRYPTMFSLSEPSKKTTSHLLNLVTDTKIPLVPFPDPLETLRTLGENIDEDFLFLLPSEDGDGYALKGYVTCFPAGFNTREKFEMKLRDVHEPVPGYKEKLEKSMDRFFEKLEVGRLVKRVNWSITTHDRLYAASGGNHLYEGEEPEAEETYMRCERQMLHRLAQTEALVFSFKTYLYPIKDIKEEGLGGDLAAAIDGLKEGSVPAMHFYKRGVIWGEAVKEFLKS